MDVDNHAAIEKMTVDALKGWLLRDDDRRHYREKHSFFHDENYMRVVISDEAAVRTGLPEEDSGMSRQVHAVSGL